MPHHKTYTHKSQGRQLFTKFLPLHMSIIFPCPILPPSNYRYCQKSNSMSLSTKHPIYQGPNDSIDVTVLRRTWTINGNRAMAPTYAKTVLQINLDVLSKHLSNSRLNQIIQFIADTWSETRYWYAVAERPDSMAASSTSAVAGSKRATFCDYICSRWRHKT